MVLETLHIPQPVIDIAIEPATKADQDKLGQALARIAAEDPSFRVHTDTETGQTIISGMGELHLEIIVDRLMREFKVDASVGTPQVAYRETITAQAGPKATSSARAAAGANTATWARVEPCAAGTGVVFKNKIVGGPVPKEYIAPIEQGISEAWHTGILALPHGGPGVAWWTAPTTTWTPRSAPFYIAGSMGFKEAAGQGRPVLLEPVMDLEVVTPEDFVGEVMGDLNARRGRITGMESRGCIQIIHGQRAPGHHVRLRHGLA